MITLCTVLTPNHDIYKDIFIDSLMRNLKYVSKVLIAYTKDSRNRDIILNSIANRKYHELYRTTQKWKIKNVEFEQFDVPVHENEFGHSLGLHACIEKTETDHIMFSDPDLVFCCSADELYLNLTTKYNLDYVGCSHHSALANAYGFFPYLVNSLVDKKKLPPPSYLEGSLYFRYGQLLMGQDPRDDPKRDRADGKYLLPGPISEFKSELPNVKPDSLYDTGINLCLWGMRNKWKWLSFQTTDCHLYTTKYFRTSNLKVTERLKQHNIIWHSVRDDLDKLQKAYDELQGSIDD